MKYSESYKAKKAWSGLYIVIAICLLIVGAAAWFAVSRYSDKAEIKETQPKDEYNNNETPYNNSETPNPDMPDNELVPMPEMPNQNANSEAEKEPYEQQEQSSSNQSVIAYAMPANGEIIKEHSENTLQYSKTFGDMRIHYGVDIACENGTSISACADGTVKAVETSASFGKTVVIEHIGGLTVKYSALDKITVKQGDKISMGDIIGISTSVPSECNDLPHIHLEVLKESKQLNPVEALGFK